MQTIEQMSRNIENAISINDSSAMKTVVQEMQSWKAHGETNTQIQASLLKLNEKLHHDGYLPQMNIVGFEKDGAGRLLLNQSGKRELFTVDQNFKQADLHQKETHHALDKKEPLDKHENKEPTLHLDLNKGLAEKLGWKQSLSNRDQYLMEANDGSLFKYDQKTHDFVQCNDRGEPVDAKGHVVKEAKNQVHVRPGSPDDYGDDTMYARAKVTPMTADFTNPKQMMTEGLHAFRMDEAHRKELLQSSPELYQACKAEDKRELEKAHGGWGKRVRDITGKIVNDTPEEATRILKFEKECAIVMPDRIL